MFSSIWRFCYTQQNITYGDLNCQHKDETGELMRRKHNKN